MEKVCQLSWFRALPSHGRGRQFESATDHPEAPTKGLFYCHKVLIIILNTSVSIIAIFGLFCSYLALLGTFLCRFCVSFLIVPETQTQFVSLYLASDISITLPCFDVFSPYFSIRLYVSLLDKNALKRVLLVFPYLGLHSCINLLYHPHLPKKTSSPISNLNTLQIPFS